MIIRKELFSFTMPFDKDIKDYYSTLFVSQSHDKGYNKGLKSPFIRWPF
jgi:hypothetical protein